MYPYTDALALDDVYEDLIYENEIVILKSDSQTQQDALPESFALTNGYWKNYFRGCHLIRSKIFKILIVSIYLASQSELPIDRVRLFFLDFYV